MRSNPRQVNSLTYFSIDVGLFFVLIRTLEVFSFCFVIAIVGLKEAAEPVVVLPTPKEAV